jgi:hypothetical protein
VAVIGVLAAVFLMGGGDDKKSGGSGTKEIFLEPASSVGPNPFTDSVAAPSPTTTAAPTTASTAAPTTTTAGGGTPAVQSVKGTAPGLYGGTRNQKECDQQKLISFLEANKGKGQAWATVQGIQPADIRAYIEALTPAFLQDDTRVTNHGFKNGQPDQHQSVLQAGTAVLVDNKGVPRARCACGNPLLPPQQAEPNYTGEQWPGFDPANVTVVQAGDPVDNLQVRDVTDGTRIDRPVGAFTPSAPAGSSTTAASGSTGNVPGNIANKGTASSSGNSPSPPANALDGDPSTSWKSAAQGDNPALFIWQLKDNQAQQVNKVTIVPIAQPGFGFASVTLTIFTADGGELFKETKSLAGSPDPVVSFSPNLKIGRFVLTFDGYENPSGSGIAELQVT